MKQHKLLIVDDEWLISDSISSMEEWGERNIEVVGTAATGREALAWIDREPVDLVITDIRMPDMDGLELLQQLYASNPDIQVVIISGYEEFSYARTALKYQARGYVLKPIDTDELLAIIDGIIADEERRESAHDASSSVEDDVPATYHELIVTKAIAYMKSNLHRPVTLKEAAEEAHLTPHYFGQLFKTITGHSFIAYLTNLRMEKACELLKDPLLRIYDIGLHVGYSDSKYFTKVFCKTYGLTPKEYKQRLGKQG
ncbi:response regulator transcription factor [Paenibacillus puerhi]|uniref:response regulator transcription factor n=1 Tax=Paenibacillus puerhi TaxID=2692622 RepID=UPI0013575C4B|nr:response regulator [Paenibacillus puerhi]